MMWETTMNPETRHLVQVKMEDFDELYLKEVDDTFNVLLGDDLEGRREIITKEIKNYIEVVDCE